MLRLYALGLLAGTLLFAAFMGVYGYRIWGDSHDRLNDRAALMLERLEERMGLDLREVVGDLRYLAGRAELKRLGYGGDDDESADGAVALLEHLTHDFHGFSEQKRRYDQIRYLDRHGREAVRVNLTRDGARQVPAEGLQEKAGRYYVTETMALAPGEVYVSRFDLNIERGRVEVPLKPVIRVATPLSEGRGMVVLNYLGARLLDGLKRAALGFPGRVMLVDDEGHFLLGGPREEDWAFMFDADVEGGFKRVHPEVWRVARKGGAGVVESGVGLFHFATFHFYSEATGLNEVPPHLQRSWRLVVWVPHEEIAARTRLWVRDLLPQAVALYLLFAAGYWLYLRLRRNQRDAEAHIARLNHDIARERDLFVAGPTVMLKWRNEYGWPVEYISPNVREVLGYDPERFMRGRISLAGIVAPEFLAQLAEEMERAKGAARGGRVGEVNGEADGGWFEHAPFQVVRADGERCWLQVTSLAVRAAEGHVSHEIGYFNDITERRHAEEAFRRISRQNALIISSVGEGIYGIDPEGNATFFNEAAAKMTGWRAEDVIGAHNHELLHHSHEDGTPYPPERCPVHATVLDGRVRRIRGEVFWRADGSPFPVEYVVAPLRDEAGGDGGAVVVFRDISERLEAERALREAKGAAEAANRAKSEFLAAMSHDIRTPMNTILGMDELLEGSELNDEQRRWLEVSTRAGESLLDLINNILDLSKIESGQLTLERAPFSLIELATAAAQILSVAAERKGVVLETRLAPDLPHVVEGDAARLRQVLINLLGNAVKFTDEGAVTLALALEADHRVRFEVSDSGVGIPADRLQAIFDPFVQAEASTTRRFGGTGLGLAICKRLVEGMGGALEVESRPGEGSTFRFRIALSPYIGEAAIAHRPERAMEAVRAEGGDRPLDLLVAEDAEDNRLLVEAFLKESPHRLHFAENGREAVHRFQERRFDLVLMDIQMPEMDGLEATRRIRAWELEARRHPTPIVALTAHAMAEQREQSIEAGCDLHLTKPLKRKRLLQVIEEFGNRG